MDGCALTERQKKADYVQKSGVYGERAERDSKKAGVVSSVREILYQARRRELNCKEMQTRK
jgi:hypothetical protein